MDFHIDTGSSINTITEAAFNGLNFAPRLDKCNTPFFGYKSDTPLPILGQFITNIVCEGVCVKAAYIVVQGSAERLISYQTAFDFNIIKPINFVSETASQHKQSCVEPHSIGQSKDALIDRFTELFSEKLGCGKGVKDKLDVNPNVKPVRQRQGLIAIHVREA